MEADWFLLIAQLAVSIYNEKRKISVRNTVRNRCQSFDRMIEVESEVEH